MIKLKLKSRTLSTNSQTTLILKCYKTHTNMPQVFKKPMYKGLSPSGKRPLRFSIRADLPIYVTLTMNNY